MSVLNPKADFSLMAHDAVDRIARDPHAPRARRRAARAYLADLARQAFDGAVRRLNGATPAVRRLAARIGMKTAAPPPAAPLILRSATFAETGAEYEAVFAQARIRPDRMPAVDAARARLLAQRSRYAAAAAETGVPWALIGLIHGLEAGFRPDRHLHNGDPLIARTVHVPAGRPVAGTPPFTWEESAVDALRYMALDRVSDWSLGRCLFELERYNGFGYRMRGLPSPYLWSFTDQYTAGKYVSDGVFDPRAVSAQVGAAAVLMRMIGRGDLIVKAAFAA